MIKEVVDMVIPVSEKTVIKYLSDPLNIAKYFKEVYSITNVERDKYIIKAKFGVNLKLNMYKVVLSSVRSSIITYTIVHETFPRVTLKAENVIIGRFKETFLRINLEYSGLFESKVKSRYKDITQKMQNDLPEEFKQFESKLSEDVV
ncbi:hypothetical protein [Acidianus sp. RZ1]|uniref:hypothetical protein n=1 Tax=Acidianus sp. RZ1 TaxID=1540082 RepID=UPI001492A9CF|nr:hypothetical protein [Acidianus sp. RZ1]NON62298.1 hypothetical protein [Acidianus sp. RZ1]